MSDTLSEKDWFSLLHLIKHKRCTPFLGAGACYGSLPLGGDIAQDLAKQHGYPFGDAHDLVRVAQFLAVEYGPMFPKFELLGRFEDVPPPDFRADDEPHALLADLPLPVYLTTNYDDFMVQALRRRDRDPRREICRWNAQLDHEPSVFADGSYRPTSANPVVFHLHGHAGLPDSIVLTEDDYLEFLAGMVGEESLLPKPIRDALSASACLFIGYRLADWNFRVLFQSLRRVRFQQQANYAVMLPPGDSEEARRRAKDYLDRYFASLDLRIFWGTARQFCGDLRRRWSDFNQAA